MRIFYSDHFPLPLPEGHRFPMQKYRRLRRRVEEWGRAVQLLRPSAASDREILRAHDPGYLERVAGGRLNPPEVRRIGFPWSPQMVERSRRSAGATLEACRAALADGVSVSLAGGTHHAFADRGEGFCVFNDSAIAARALVAEGLATRVAVVDCDVHQGNGTAAIAGGDPALYTFSIHGRHNFPFRKERSDLDIGLADGTGDEAYLRELAQGLDAALAASGADFVIYLSGADPYRGDRLGRLALSKRGLELRDRLVLEECLSRRLPVAVTMGGGYAAEVEDIVDIHFQTVAVARKFAAPVARPSRP